MKHNIQDKILALRLFEDEDVIKSILDVFQSVKCCLGIIISGAGMMKDITIGFFKGKGQYKEIKFDGPYEIVSFTGNIISQGTEVIAHIHLSLADEEGKVIGGHLLGSRIYGTGEIFIRLSDIPARRELEEKTQLKGLIL